LTGNRPGTTAQFSSGIDSKYPDQFRRDALELVKSSRRPTAEVARSLGVSENTLWNWVRAARDADPRAVDPDALSESERDELRRLARRTSSCAPTPRF
jgi:transposase